MHEESKRGRGRPKKENPLSREFIFRGTEEHTRMRRALEEKLNMTGGEVMREALEMLYVLKMKYDKQKGENNERE